MHIIFRERERERESRRSPVVRVRWCWVNFQCRGVQLIWIIVGKGPIAFAVDAGEACLDIFPSSIFFSFLSPSFGDGPIQTVILSQRNK